MSGNQYIIEHFMWGHQHHAQISFEVVAEALFNKIEEELNPNVFLIGVLTEEKNDSYKICIEPNDGKYEASAFEEVINLAAELRKVDINNRHFQTDPHAQRMQDERVDNNSFRQAILKILRGEDVEGGMAKFISYPTYVEGYLVFVVLELKTKAIRKHYSLNRTVGLHRIEIRRSLIDSAAKVFLREASNSLKEPNRGEFIERDTSELIRDAGKEIMYTIAQAGENFEGLRGLFETCNAISSLKYEGAEGLGTLIIAKKNHKNIRMTLRLEEPIDILDFRKVRKFLEISDDKATIVSDSAYIYGLGELHGKYNPKDESLFEINFISHYKWEAKHDNNSLLVVTYGDPLLPKDAIDRDKFYSDIERIFIGIDKHQIDDLWDIILKATEQAHGTMLVISEKAKSEAVRLGRQSFQLKPMKLTSNLVKQLTSIDGAVLLDKNSICYAIGVILDGLATEKGDSSRGARYNSAIRYYEHIQKEAPTIIIIVSEDGMINLIPKLIPQIKKWDITKAINELRRLSNSTNISTRVFNKIMRNFHKIEFYLTKEECDEVNALRDYIVASGKSPNPFTINYNDLKPNSEMNDSYYIKM